ncbi:DUF6939 family protein [Microcoleus asticus]
MERKRKKLETIGKQYAQAEIVDVTFKADQHSLNFSPFYPQGGIPIPFSFNTVGASVAGI